MKPTRKVRENRMHKIDFIVTWVDGNDSNWQQEKDFYKLYKENTCDSRIVRYRDWDNLKYWFRGVEQFAPWVNKIFFITWGHVPTWLNTKNPKLVVVKHTDYIPSKWLPTFSSRTIDMNFHRIKGLSEHFVYFNDDMFLISPVKTKNFFKKGLPCSTAILNAACPGVGMKKTNSDSIIADSYSAPFFDLLPINQHFSKRQSIKSNWTKWIAPQYGFSIFRTLLLLPWRGFTGFMNYHLPYSYLKSTYEEVWDNVPNLLTLSCEHKFRVPMDLNHWIFDYWQLAKGDFYPRSPKTGKSYWLSNDEEKNAEVFKIILKQKYKMICVNDSVEDGDFEKVKEKLNNCFNAVLPNKSLFEK